MKKTKYENLVINGIDFNEMFDKFDESIHFDDYTDPEKILICSMMIKYFSSHIKMYSKDYICNSSLEDVKNSLEIIKKSKSFAEYRLGYSIEWLEEYIAEVEKRNKPINKLMKKHEA